MLKPGQKTPALELPLTIDAKFKLSDQNPEHFTMLVFYRGMHCPICKKYLEELGNRLSDFTDNGVSPFAISMDSPERAQVAHDDWDTGDLPLAHSMTDNQAREWGLYISEGRPDSKEPPKFSEPGLFLIRPNGELFFAVTQSAPFTRPSLDQLLEGIEFVTKNDYPTRGTLT